MIMKADGQFSVSKDPEVTRQRQLRQGILLSLGLYGFTIGGAFALDKLMGAGLRAIAADYKERVEGRQSGAKQVDEHVESPLMPGQIPHKDK